MRWGIYLDLWGGSEMSFWGVRGLISEWISFSGGGWSVLEKIFLVWVFLMAASWRISYFCFWNIGVFFMGMIFIIRRYLKICWSYNFSDYIYVVFYLDFNCLITFMVDVWRCRGGHWWISFKIVSFFRVMSVSFDFIERYLDGSFLGGGKFYVLRGSLEIMKCRRSWGSGWWDCWGCYWCGFCFCGCLFGCFGYFNLINLISLSLNYWVMRRDWDCYYHFYF
jgi:hypothetical protein